MMSNWTLKCEECGSTNVVYEHEFIPMELISEIRITCKDCGHIKYLDKW